MTKEQNRTVDMIIANFALTQEEHKIISEILLNAKDRTFTEARSIDIENKKRNKKNEF